MRRQTQKAYRKDGKRCYPTQKRNGAHGARVTRYTVRARAAARGRAARGQMARTVATDADGGVDGDGLRCICATARRLATGGWCWTACRQARGVVDDRWTMSGIWKHFIRENEGRARKAGGTPFGTEKTRFYWGFRGFLLGAGGGTRTLTYSRTADFESASNIDFIGFFEKAWIMSGLCLHFIRRFDIIRRGTA